ncbi:MAG: hypothetical protein K6E59_06330 [Bacilli bacterium]|nr:hypothetical protein [Bacilli bacterium]
MNHFLYSELANWERGEADADKAIEKLFAAGFPIDRKTSVLGLKVDSFLKEMSSEDAVVLFGGDGTLNHFANQLSEGPLPCPVYLCPTEKGCDFQRDLPMDFLDAETGLYRIDSLLVGLPVVEVEGKAYRFLNGVGLGIDGECCIYAEEKKTRGQKVHYGKIGAGLLLGPYMPATATITVDGGEPKTFHKVYLASTMNGRYCGGGVAMAPEQDRRSGKITFVCVYGMNRIQALILFPRLFKGTHVVKQNNVFIAQGERVEVNFDRPCGIQIDGEVLTGVTSYKAYVPK